MTNPNQRNTFTLKTTKKCQRNQNFYMIKSTEKSKSASGNRAELGKKYKPFGG